MGAEGDFQQHIYKWKSGDAFADDLEREIGQFKSDKVFFFEAASLKFGHTSYIDLVTRLVMQCFPFTDFTWPAVQVY